MISVAGGINVNTVDEYKAMGADVNGKKTGNAIKVLNSHTGSPFSKGSDIAVVFRFLS